MADPATVILRRQGKSKQGIEYLIRPTTNDDAHASVELIDTVASEGKWLLNSPGDRTVTDEVIALASILSGGGLALTLEIQTQLVGRLTVQRKFAIYERHCGELGMLITRQYRDQGLGRALVEAAVDWAKAVRLTKLCLMVLIGNDLAIGLYKKMGFIEEGIQHRQVQTVRGYQDLMLMGLLVE